MTDNPFERRFQRERKARKEAERILESKSRELYESNQALKLLAEQLENKVIERTAELEQERNRALKLSKAKSEFVATMSHEIRTPINGVLGALQLLESEVQSTESHRLLDIANHSASVLLHIINDILDFSKIEAGQMEIESIPFDLKQLCENCLQAQQKTAQQKQISLQLNWDYSLNAWQQGDPYRVTQIINNYLSNALKFTHQGKIVIQVQQLQNEIKLSVIDTGIGISAAGIERLFSDFSQVDSSTSRRFGGTGLGLAICKKLAELMQGSVGVKSTQEVGSVFWLTLPDRPTEAVEKSQNRINLADIEQAHRSILLVDDNHVNRMIGKKILEKIGHEVDLAESGQEAIEHFLSHQMPPFDLILMDCQMPEMDGFQTTETIRKINSQIPIIALTANTSEEDRQKAIDSGMNDFLSKPFKADEIQAMIMKY